MFAYNKEGIAFQDRSRRPETVVTHTPTPPAAEAATKLYHLNTRCRCTLPSTLSASVFEPKCKQDAKHRGRQLLNSFIPVYWSGLTGGPTIGHYGPTIMATVASPVS
jgi:hypothetical protein